MIEYKQGNLLDVTQGIIVHGCNQQYVFGAGVALAVRQKYPKCYEQYKDPYERLYLGRVIWYDHSDADESSELFIANAITQEHYGTNKRHVNYAAIVGCFEEVFAKARAYDYDVHFPKIGAGLAGGDWDIIEQLINDCDPYDKVKKTCWVLPENK